MQQDFKEIMSKRTNSELLEITTFLRKDYQPEAVIAAEEELKSRNLTDQELADIKSKLDRKRSDKKQSTKSLNMVDGIVNIINPLAEKTAERQIKITAIGLTIIFLIYLIRDWRLTILLVQDVGNADISFLEYFIPLILFPAGIYGFWTMRRYGWVILAILLTYLILTTLFTIGMEIKWGSYQPLHFENNEFLQIQNADDSVLNKLVFPFYIIQFVLFIWFLVFLNKKAIVEKFALKRRTQFVVIGFSAVLFLILGMIMLL